MDWNSLLFLSNSSSIITFRREMEGPLSKWTNVLEGWQYRWFVLDETAGILTYYTSKEKMTKGERRGCVRLKGAVIGIDDEDDSTFTITVDQKMFHFQARDSAERESWIRALEATVQRVSGYYKFRGKNSMSNVPSIQKSCQEFDRRISEADAYLQLMLDNIKDLESKLEKCQPGEEKDKLKKIVEIAQAMSESVKHSIVFLQMTKNQFCSGESMLQSMANSITQSDIKCEDSRAENLVVAAAPANRVHLHAAIRSYSSSDEEESDEIFFDTLDTNHDTLNVKNDDVCYAQDALSYVEENGEDGSGSAVVVKTTTKHAAAIAASTKTADDDFGQENIDFDAVYEDDEEDELEDVKEHGSIIMHMLSQLSVGMDLTKITLPTFILERRSLLEMFADFFAHPDLFARITDQSNPEERMLAVVKWYLSSFHAGRKSSVAKKPYNPIIGETFRCRWNVPRCADEEDVVSDGPYPGSHKSQLTFLAEQVSHHPPVSAFYAEHPSKNVYLNGHIWTKSKFLGLSIAVHNVGQACLNMPDHNEQYILTFPSGYGRSILGTPWIELGGKCSIKCVESGYLANVEFLTKPFYGGRAHNIKAEIYRPGVKTPFATIKGQWNGQMFIKMCNSSEETIFLDVHQIPVVKKLVAPISQQADFESRKLWRHVTAALKQKNVHLATKAKHFLEQRQRQEAKDRAEKSLQWRPAHFTLDKPPNNENWVYNRPLYARSS